MCVRQPKALFFLLRLERTLDTNLFISTNETETKKDHIFTQLLVHKHHVPEERIREL